MFLNTFIGKIISTFVISMVPIIELRGAIPFGVANGLPLLLVCFISIIGNIIPVPFVILFIRRIFEWLRTKNEKLDNLVLRFEERAMNKSKLVQRYTFWGLFLFVAIPLPGTGAWTGSLIAAMLEIRLKIAIPAILLGLFCASIIMSCVTYGVGALFFF